VQIDAGGGVLQLTAQKDENLPMPGLKVFLFNGAGTYLGRKATTDASGKVEFSVPEAAYELRVDYLGYQFWSEEVLVIEDTTAEMPIIHQSVEIATQGSFQDTLAPIEGIRVYLFSPTGTYLGQTKLTDADGKAIFDLPQKSYKVRADYLGHQFWSEDFQSHDTTVTISRGLAEIHVQRSGNDVVGAKVYLFSENGSYLGWNEITNPSGHAEFMLPDRAVKFRIDVDGGRHWTPVIQILAGQANAVDVDLDH
jgi:hypothetical protein